MRLCGRRCGTSPFSAHHLLKTSIAVTHATTPQKVTALLLRIFLARLAVEAVARVRERVETIERDVVAALVALAKGVGRAIETTQPFVDVQEEASLLARPQ